MSKKRHKEKHSHDKGHHQRRLLSKKVYFILAIAVSIILIGGTVAFVVDRTGAPSPPATAAESRSPGTFLPSLGNQHINDPNATGIRYNSDPPTSGPHFGGGLARWGIHTEPIPKGLMVHNLEDGGVVVSYTPQTPKETVEKLGQIASRYPAHIILAPYPGLDTLIALTAWQRIDKLEAFDEARIVRFIKAYQGIDHHVRRPQ